MLQKAGPVAWNHIKMIESKRNCPVALYPDIKAVIYIISFLKTGMLRQLP